jgi:signal transduction histidine kinase
MSNKTQEARTLQEARILIVDDAADTIQFLQVLLKTAGYKNLASTTDPQAALPLFSQFQPDLILLDLMMPNMDGFEVMAQLQPLLTTETYLPILVLTADISRESKEKALRAGAKDFLTKPFDSAEVLLRIRNLLETRFLHLELRCRSQRLEEQNQLLDEKVREITLRRQEAQQALESLRTSEERLRLAHEHLQVLSQRLIEAQEVERRRIAHELHDEIGAALTAAKINMQAAQQVAAQQLSQPESGSLVTHLGEHLGEGIAIVERTLQQVRELSLELRPSMLDDFGLVDTLAWYVDRQSRWGGLEARFKHDLQRHGPEHKQNGEKSIIEERLPTAIETACFRVAQEALTNVLRHARARHLEVELHQTPDTLELVVRDDGIGFDTVQSRAMHWSSFGMLGMEERVLLVGGMIEITSSLGSGTEIQACFPLERTTSIGERNVTSTSMGVPA